MKTYTYDPIKIKENGKDRMRFELGDTMIEGAEETCALSDEEYTAILEFYPGKWRRAKLALIESILRRFSYEVDTKVGPLSLSLRQRVEGWQKMYDDLKAEIIKCGVPSANPAAISDEHYFFEGIHDNRDLNGTEGGGRLVH